MNKANFYQSIVEQTSVGYSYSKTIYDDMGVPVDYEIIEMNKAYELMIGIQEKDWIGKRISELYESIKNEPINSNDYYHFLLTKQIEKDLDMTFKYLGKHYRMKMHSPQKLYVITSLTDITVEIEETQKLQTLFDSVPIQVWYLKDTETYLSANKVHADFIGFKSDELIDKNINDILVSTNADVCIRNNDIVFREKKESISQEWAKNSQGEKRLLNITRKPKLNEKNEIDFVVCSAEDITEDYLNKQQKEMQEEILYSSIDFTQELLTNENLEEALANGIEMLGNATKVDRVYYWENHYNEASKELLTSSKIEWYLDDAQRILSKPQNQSISFEEIADFITPLSQNRSFSGFTEELNEASPTKHFLRSRGIISLLTLPVFSHDDFIGFIGFESYNFEREWSMVEISLLSSFVLLYENAFERDRLEQEIKQEKDNFFNFFNMVEDALLVVDLKGKIIDVNNNVFERLNYTKEEVIGESFQKLLPTNKSNQMISDFNDILTKGTEHFKLNVMTKDGIIFPMELRNSRGIWNGEPAIFAVGKDISELTLSEDKFSKAFNNSGISMFISRFKDGKFLEVNDKFTEFFGYEKDKIIGRTTLDIQMTRDYDNRDVFKEMIRKDQKIVDLEIQFIDKDQKIRTGLTNIIPVTINNEKCLLTSIIDISDRIKNEKEIIELSTRDHLTGIYNRRFIYEMLQEIIEDSKREQSPFSVAIIDIDNFKNINDQYGHQFGDDVLIEFSKTIKDNLRSNDVLGRYGGEEFIIIINHVDIDKSNAVLERVLDGTRNKIFKHAEEQIDLTFSAGVVSCKELTKDELTIDKLVEIADKRMYRAKKEGKNKIIYKD